MKFTVVLAIALLVAGAFAECEFTVDGHTYDFSSLTHVQGAREILYHTTDDGGRVYVNFCDHSTVVCPGEMTNVCLLTGEWNYTVRGEVDKVTVGKLEDTQFGEEGVTALFASSEACSDNETFSTKVHLYCTNESRPSVLDVVGTEKDCQLVMHVKAKAACLNPLPSSSSSSATSSAKSSTASSTKSQSSDASRACYSLVLLVLAFLLF